MNRIAACAAMLALAGILSCSNIAVRADWDTSADLHALHSWAWLPAPAAPEGDLRASPLVRQRIRDAVTQTLVSRGHPEVEPVAADFWVATHAGIERKVDVQTIYRSYGRAGWGGGGWADTVVDEYDQGTLVIDFLRAGSGELLWRGTAEARVDESGDPEQRTARVNEAVERILAQFPPES